MLASDITSRASRILLDASNTRWTVAELLNWITDAQRAVANARPAATATTAAVQLTADQSLQAIPAAAFMLINITHNLGSDGNTPGKRIRHVDWTTLLAHQETMYSAVGTAEVSNYAYVPHERPLEFLVYPRAHATTPVYVSMTYAKRPVEVTDAGDTLTVADDYLNPVLDFVMFRAFSKDTEFSDNGKAVAFYNSYASALGLKRMSVVG